MGAHCRRLEDAGANLTATPLPENQGPLIHHVISTHLVPFFVILFFIFSDSVLHGPAHHDL